MAALTCSPSESAPPGSGGGSAHAWECTAEICDGFDNDCDGRVDEDCPCVTGQQQACYAGNPITVGIGECATGVQLCENERWAECVGQSRPADETCSDGFDNDCDGQVDEGCPCNTGATQDCYRGNPITVGIGQCLRGTQSCSDGLWTDCAGDVTPVAEQCDGLDNDCNGEADDGCGGAGGSGIGGSGGSGVGGSVDGGVAGSGGAGASGGDAGPTACGLPGCSAPANCQEACDDLFECSEKICEALPLCPGFNHGAGTVDRTTFLSQCESNCDAGQLSMVQPCDCALTVENVKSISQYANACANGCSVAWRSRTGTGAAATWLGLALALVRIRRRSGRAIWRDRPGGSSAA
jgi:hypothetical protein